MRTTSANILLVEDTASMAQLYCAFLQKEGHSVETVRTVATAREQLATRLFDAVVLDLNLPDADGRQVLQTVVDADLPTSVIVITSDGSVNTAVEAMRAGAFDFIVKPFNADRLNTTVRNALERARLKSDVDILKDSFGHRQFCGFIGSSVAMQAVYHALEAAAPSTATVFITGESGTGKEVAADAVHRLSKKRNGAFIALNCAAIPKELVESEVFGHVKGAFSGAVSDRPGAVAQANGGTLFLDEICEMQIDLQSKLLRFLQTGTYQPVGGRKLERADLRVVCATNRDPMHEVTQGNFREDLFYRLHVLPVHLPPLRERDDDVVEIAQALVERFTAEEGKSFKGLAPDAEAALRRHPWPGNVRELQNVLRRAVVMHDGPALTAAMLPLTAAPMSPEPAPSAPLVAPAKPATHASATDCQSWGTERDIATLSDIEKAAINRAVELCDGNIPRAAGFLGVSPSTLYRKRQAWGEA